MGPALILSSILCRSHLEVAARPLQRAYVQCVYVQVEAALKAELRSLAAGPGLELKTQYLPQQLARMVSVRKLLMAVEVCGGEGEGVHMRGCRSDGFHSVSAISHGSRSHAMDGL